MSTEQMRTNGGRVMGRGRPSAGDPWRADDGRDHASLASRERRAELLGWFSVGLGAIEILAPRALAELIGAPYDARKRATMWGLGLREVAAGVGLLTRREPVGWVWSRVFGDVMDLGLLGAAMRSPRANRNRLLAASAAVVGVTVLDVLTAQRMSNERGTTGTSRRALERGGIFVRQAVTVACSPEDAYRFWRSLENLPRFMVHLESVTEEGSRSHWRAKGPAGTSVEWDAEIISDRPNELIAWRSVPGSEIPNAGRVRFIAAPGGRGTEIHVELRYDPPGRGVGAFFAKLFGEEPNQQIKGDLRRLKQVIEVGEVVHSDASIHRWKHAAQPSKPEQGRRRADEKRERPQGQTRISQRGVEAS